MKEEYLKIIKEKGEFDFEVSSLVETLTLKEYEELKSMLITAIGIMEEMRRKTYIDMETKIDGKKLLEILDKEGKQCTNY